MMAEVSKLDLESEYIQSRPLKSLVSKLHIVDASNVEMDYALIASCLD